MAANPNLLLVEGQDEKRLIPEVVERALGRAWEPSKGVHLAEIVPCGSVEALLESLRVKWQEPGRQIVGVIVDCDDDLEARWQALRARASAALNAALPNAIPAEGLVAEVGEGRAFGVWIMPDNTSIGMLESFLQHLRPQQNQALLDHAKRSVEESSRLGAPWKGVHRDKAEIHTWLSWQDPPGRQLHQAVQQGMLDVSQPLSKKFAEWFERLYRL